MSPELLPVLINALSEQGAFQQDGTAVTTTRECLSFSISMLDINQVLSGWRFEG